MTNWSHYSYLHLNFAYNNCLIVSISLTKFLFVIGHDYAYSHVYIPKKKNISFAIKDEKITILRLNFWPLSTCNLRLFVEYALEVPRGKSLCGVMMLIFKNLSETKLLSCSVEIYEWSLNHKGIFVGYKMRFCGSLPLINEYCVLMWI